MLDTRVRTLAAVSAVATGFVAGAAVALAVAKGAERHLVRGESMVPALRPRDTVVSLRRDSFAGRVVPLRAGMIVVLELPWEHDLVGIKRLVAGPGEAWADGDDRIPSGDGWAVVGDQRVLSTDSRHHGRVPVEAIRGVVIARVPPRGD